MKKSLIIFLVFSFLLAQTPACKLAAKKSSKPKSEVFKPSGKEVKVDALYFQETPEGPTGGTASVRVRAKANKTGQLRVGFFEEEVGGSGLMWRSAGWMSAIISTFLLGLDLADYSFTFDVGGYIDGPSAGALMTIAVFSSLLGDEIKKDVAMTGTINPDGTIGPVGGIPQKIEGAKKAKKKTVLVPAGQRHSLDLKTNQVVDVVEFGRQKGITVKEVSDIYQAYKHFTGEELPQPEVSDEKPELSSSTYGKIKSKSTDWYSRYTQIKSSYDALPPDYKPEELNSIMTVAANSADKSSTYLDQGLVAPSYDRATTAVIFADIAYQAAKIVEAFVAGGMQQAQNNLETARSSWLKTDSMFDRLKSENPRSLSDVLALNNAYGTFSVALGLGQLGDKARDKEAATDEEGLENLATATLYYSLAGHVLSMAEDSVDIGMGLGVEKSPTKKRVRRIAEALRRAAEANINYFDNVVLNRQAQSQGLSLDLYKEAFKENDFEYTFATSAIEVLPSLKEQLGPGKAQDYATLGNSMQSFSLSSGLIAQYYSLDAQLDESGNIIGVGNEKALINMLDIAEKKAVENINLAKKQKADPALPTYYYESGKIMREGDLNEKFDALYNFWLASIQGRILSMLGGVKIVD
ncbi:MAG TPA: S16 family serine protease [Candidatus Subteraquimicrobiales bacterium]